jgi:biopolymer transport protein TolQ
MELTSTPVITLSVWQIISETSSFGLVILIILAAMSVLSWGVIFSKWRQFKSVEADNKAFWYGFSRSRRLGENVNAARTQTRSMISRIFLAGFTQLSELSEARNGGGQQNQVVPLNEEDFEIVEMTMEKAEVEELGRLEKQVVLLATTANSAPFLGLLGTVVGIMDAFWSIGERGSASLAIVAPGIAEALLATIVGLGAAIPAVMAYNWANARMKSLSDASNNFILEFLTRAKKENR